MIATGDAPYVLTRLIDGAGASGLVSYHFVDDTTLLNLCLAVAQPLVKFGMKPRGMYNAALARAATTAYEKAKGGAGPK